MWRLESRVPGHIPPAAARRAFQQQQQRTTAPSTSQRPLWCWPHGTHQGEHAPGTTPRPLHSTAKPLLQAEDDTPPTPPPQDVFELSLTVDDNNNNNSSSSSVSSSSSSMAQNLRRTETLSDLRQYNYQLNKPVANLLSFLRHQRSTTRTSGTAVHQPISASQAATRLSALARFLSNSLASYSTTSPYVIGGEHLDQPSQLEKSAAVHPTLQLILQRKQQGSRPLKRMDRYKLGLVVEGGGMRGVVTGAMLMGLGDLEVRDCFDVVYGASAGAINATYFLSGQRHGLDVYTKDIANASFLDLRRMLVGQPAMNLDFLVDHVMENVRPLCWKSVLHSEIPLKVVASNLDTLAPHVLSNFTDKEDLIDCLKASCNVPTIVGPPRQVRGHRLVDAAIFEPIPVKAAINDGCTHILALCSRPANKGSTWKKYISKRVVSAVKRTFFSPPYMKAAWDAEQHNLMHQGVLIDDYLMQALDGYPKDAPNMDQLNEGTDSFVYPIYPGPAAGFAPICIDVRVLEQGMQEGFTAVKAAFSPALDKYSMQKQA